MHKFTRHCASIRLRTSSARMREQRRTGDSGDAPAKNRERRRDSADVATRVAQASSQPDNPSMTADRPTPKDVRMHGFSQRAEVGSVLAWIDRHAPRLGHMSASLDQASARVLARQVIASIDVPAFDRAAMDGYALHGDESSGATDYNPLAFEVLGQALPGRPFDGAVPAASAVRIMTGAALPAGARSVGPADPPREAPGRVEITAAG